MASVHKEIFIPVSPDDAWAALREWSDPHTKLVPGFVVETTMDGDDRLVTFFNGVTVRERLIDLDPKRRRLVWSVVDGPYTHHNASAQVLADTTEGAGTRFVWIADFLPDDQAETMAGMIQRGLNVILETLTYQASADRGRP